MPPTRFPYRASVVRRSLYVNAALVALGLFYFVAARPLQWHWVDFAMLLGLVFYGVRFLHDVVRLSRPLPALVIGDDGLSDPALSGQPIPWEAIREIRVGRVRGLGQLFLIAESERLPTSPGGVAIKFANWVRGARPGRKSADMALPMSPSVALEATMDDVVAAIRARPRGTTIPIVEAQPGTTAS